MESQGGVELVNGLSYISAVSGSKKGIGLNCGLPPNFSLWAFISLATCTSLSIEVGAPGGATVFPLPCSLLTFSASTVSC